MSRLGGVALALALLANASGCSVIWNANAKHTGGQGACSDDASGPLLDAVLAAAAIGTIILSDALDDSYAWLAIPGVLGASAVYGAFSTHGCTKRQKERDRGREAAEPASPSGAGKAIEVPRPRAKPPLPGPACSIEPLVECPPGHACVAEDGNSGYCRPDT